MISLRGFSGFRGFVSATRREWQCEKYLRAETNPQYPQNPRRHATTPTEDQEHVASDSANHHLHLDAWDASTTGAEHRLPSAGAQAREACRRLGLVRTSLRPGLHRHDGEQPGVHARTVRPSRARRTVVIGLARSAAQRACVGCLLLLVRAGAPAPARAAAGRRVARAPDPPPTFGSPSRGGWRAGELRERIEKLPSETF